MAVALAPSTGVAEPRGKLTFVGSGGTAPYVYSLVQNESGATIDSATGAYVAGPKPVTQDIVKVTDAATATAAASVSVQGGNYEVYQAGLAPPFLKGPNAAVVERQYGAEKDVQLERARQGLLANIPGVCPPDALDFIGQERGLLRATAESPSDNGGARDQAYAERLRTCWDAPTGWAFAGSHAGLLYALDRAGFPMGDPSGAHIMQRYRRYSWLSASGGTPVYGTHPVWTFDGSDPRLWNQFGIIFGADVSDLIVGSARAAQLNAIVDQWRPRKARFMGTWIIVSGPTWGWPVGVTWGQVGRTWGGGVTRFIPPL
ncbi:MAG TPA: hypothetical protein VN962_25375 [Polyangia bacterium]|nr:hypothetical protein [Polyangia bacterium]